MKVYRPRTVLKLFASIHSQRPSKIAIAVLALGISFLGNSTAMAATRTWTTFGNGSFNDSANWFPVGVPNVNDYVSFEVGSGTPYTVTFPGNLVFDPIANYSTSHLRVRDQTVTFTGSSQLNRNSSTYTVASTTQTELNRGIIIGISAGETSILTSGPGNISGLGISNFNGVAATIGDEANATGTFNVNVGSLNITGSNPNETQLIVGNNGTGTLNINNGADLNVPGFNSRVSLGHHANGVGAISINGVGSTWTNSNELWVGASGTGNLTIQNGGRLNSSSQAGFSSILGVFPGSNGMVTISGSGSTWINSTELRIGNSGDGSLTVSNGGSFLNSNVLAPTIVGGGSGRNGVLEISGAGSNWNSSGVMYVGSTGTGALTVNNGGSLTTGSSRIGGLNSGSGQVLVGGSGANWNVTTGPLTIGFRESGFANAPGSLTINSGGSVNVTQDIDLHTNGLLKLQGGSLSTASIGFLDTQFLGQFQWTSGTLHVGVFHGGLTNSAGILAPGQSAGQTIIDGFYNQQASATLQIEIGGTIPETQYDYVLVEGPASLNGQLQLDLINGFVPTPQQTFTVFDSSGITGSFSNIANGLRLPTSNGQGSFVVRYGNSSTANPNQIVLSDFLAGQMGDFNGDGTYNCIDIDGLVSVIAAGTNASAFDLTGNGLVDGADLTTWRTLAGAVNNASGNPFRPGDANLDGVVDGSDFGVWNAHKFTSLPAWCSGDFNADGLIDGSDFGVWNANKFTSSDSTSAVPEPTGMATLGLALIALAARKNRKQS